MFSGEEWRSRPLFSHVAEHTGGGLLLNKFKRQLFNLMSCVNCAGWAGGRKVAGMGQRAHIYVLFDYMESSPLKKQTIQFRHKVHSKYVV